MDKNIDQLFNFSLESLYSRKLSEKKSNLISVVTTKKDNVFTCEKICMVISLFSPDSQAQICTGLWFHGLVDHTKHQQCLRLFCQLYQSCIIPSAIEKGPRGLFRSDLCGCVCVCVTTGNKECLTETNLRLLFDSSPHSVPQGFASSPTTNHILKSKRSSQCLFSNKALHRKPQHA